MKQQLFWKSMLSDSSSEKVSAVEGDVFWKFIRSKRGSTPEKVGNAEYFFSEKLAFSKCSSSEKADAVQKYLLRQSSSSVDIFILSNSSAKKVAVPKSSNPKELPILNKWNYVFWKINAAWKWLFWRRSSSKKTAALKK